MLNVSMLLYFGCITACSLHGGAMVLLSIGNCKININQNNKCRELSIHVVYTLVQTSIWFVFGSKAL